MRALAGVGSDLSAGLGTSRLLISGAVRDALAPKASSSIVERHTINPADEKLAKAIDWDPNCPPENLYCSLLPLRELARVPQGSWSRRFKRRGTRHRPCNRRRSFSPQEAGQTPGGATRIDGNWQTRLPPHSRSLASHPPIGLRGSRCAEVLVSPLGSASLYSVQDCVE
jgi:hypothetical protein